MPSVLGFLDDSGSPCIRFHLCGVAHPPPGLKFDGVIDTGFNGFLQVPSSLAFLLKLPLEGTTNFTLADGEIVSHFQTLAMMTLAGRTETVLVALAPGSKDILVGTEILRLFRMGLLILGGKVMLVDEEDLSRATDSGLIDFPSWFGDDPPDPPLVGAP